MSDVFDERVVVGSLKALLERRVSGGAVELGLKDLRRLREPYGVAIDGVVDKALCVGNLDGVGRAVCRRCRLVFV